jgi:hypothetical protein
VPASEPAEGDDHRGDGMDEQQHGLSAEELAAETATGLPDKEVVSILDLNADLNLAIDAAAPIDLGVAANANVAAPIDAAVGANVLSTGSEAGALADQGVLLGQHIDADATANSTQASDLAQGGSPADPGAAAAGDALGGATGGAGDGSGAVGGAVGDTTGAVGDATSGVTDQAGSLADGSLLNVNVNLDGNAGIAAPIDGAVAANANVAAPIDGAVGANVGSVDSSATAVAQQDAIINQDITGSAEANTNQDSNISQP